LGREKLLALVVARTRKEDGGKLYWDGDKGWWPDINRGLRYHTEAEAKEAVADYKTLKETKGLNPDDTLGYDYVDTDDTTVLATKTPRQTDTRSENNIYTTDAARVDTLAAFLYSVR
jgi:hypothetical protein